MPVLPGGGSRLGNERFAAKEAIWLIIPDFAAVRVALAALFRVSERRGPVGGARPARIPASLARRLGGMSTLTTCRRASTTIVMSPVVVEYSRPASVPSKLARARSAASASAAVADRSGNGLGIELSFHPCGGSARNAE